MSGAAAAILGSGGSGGGGNLTVSISGGVFLAGYSDANTFPVNTAVPAGGSGTYTTIQWQENDDGAGTWTTATGAAFAPSVSGVKKYGAGSVATYNVKVTDSLGAIAISNSAVYGWDNLSGGGGGGGGGVIP